MTGRHIDVPVRLRELDTIVLDGNVHRPTGIGDDRIELADEWVTASELEERIAAADHVAFYR